MAVMVPSYCSTCRKDFTAILNSGEAIPNKCPFCKDIQEDVKRKSYFSGLDTLSIEERLCRIEEWIYDYKPKTETLY